MRLTFFNFVMRAVPGRWTRVVFGVLTMLWGLVAVVVLSAPVLAVQVQERYDYSISVWGLAAGTATMKVEDLPSTDGRALQRLVTTVRSNDFISFFFPVRNNVDSIIDSRTKLPQRLFFQRREGMRHEDFDVTFDHVAHQATVWKDGTSSVHAITPGTHDPLSSFYFVRTLPNLEPGSSVYVPIHHDRKNFQVEVQVEAVERVRGPWGDVEAIRLLAIMPFRGIFLNEGNIRFWLTNTKERIPVMMEARVIIGSVRAVLEGWSP